MVYSNVYVTVRDPDYLLAGTSQYANFVVSHAQLYRFATEALARSGEAANGTLATTFALIAESNSPTAEAGPFRWGYYDSAQVADSWYAVRYRNSGSTLFSAFSAPWKVGGAHAWELRDVLFEAGNVMGGEAKRGTATGGGVSTVTCTNLFRSSLRDARYYKGNYLVIDEDAGGAAAAPEGEERLIASVDVATGIATVDNAFSISPANGDVFQVHGYIPPSELIRAINRVRERMYLMVSADVALDMTSTAVNRYPVPMGIRSRKDVFEVQAVYDSSNARREDITVEGYEIEFDGLQGWLITRGSPESNILRVRFEKSYREVEGNLSAMGDVTRAPIEWLRKAAAWEAWRWMDDSETATTDFARLAKMTEDEVRALSARFGTGEVRSLVRRKRQAIGPRTVY